MSTAKEQDTVGGGVVLSNNINSAMAATDESSVVNPGCKGTTLVPLALQHSNRAEHSFLLEEGVQMPPLLLPASPKVAAASPAAQPLCPPNQLARAAAAS